MIFDYNEEFMMMISELQKIISKSKSPCCLENFSLIKTLEVKLSQLQDYSLKIFDNISSNFNQERLRSEGLFQKLLKSKQTAKRYFTLQQKLSNKQEIIKLKNKSLASSLKKLKDFIKLEVQDLENSLKLQQRTMKA